VKFLRLATLIDLNAQAVAIRCQTQKTRIKLNGCAGSRGFGGKSLDKPAALNDQVRILKGNLGGASIGKQFKAANLVEYAGPRIFADLPFKMIRDDEGTRRGFERGLGFQDANAAARASQLTRYMEARSGASDDNNIPGVPIAAGQCFFMVHRISLTLQPECALPYALFISRFRSAKIFYTRELECGQRKQYSGRI
jgi:hypothetical protein